MFLTPLKHLVKPSPIDGQRIELFTLSKHEEFALNCCASKMKPHVELGRRQNISTPYIQVNSNTDGA